MSWDKCKGKYIVIFFSDKFHTKDKQAIVPNINKGILSICPRYVCEFDINHPLVLKVHIKIAARQLNGRDAIFDSLSK